MCIYLAPRALVSLDPCSQAPTLQNANIEVGSSVLTGGTVILVNLIAVVPTVVEKFVFYEYLSVASVDVILYFTLLSLLQSSLYFSTSL